MATAKSTLRQLLSAEIGDVIFGSCKGTTTSDGAANGTTIIDSALKAMTPDWVRVGTGGEHPTAIKIMSGTYEGQVRFASDFSNTTGTVTLSSAFTGQIVAGTEYELHRLCHPDLKDWCLEQAVHDAFPYLYDAVDSTALRFGDWLIDGGFEVWTNPTTLTHWSKSAVTIAPNSTYRRDGAYSCALSGGAGYIEQSVTNQNDLLYLDGTSPKFYMWVRATTASQVRLAIYDGATTTYSPYHTGGGAWELLTAEATIAARPTTVAFRVLYEDAATTAYVDDGSCIGVSEKLEYDISFLGLVNDCPDQVFALYDRDANASSPKPLGESYEVTNYKLLPMGRIRFLQALNEGQKLRVVGRKYLDFTGAAASSAFAGARFIDLLDTFTSYAGRSLQTIRVKADETGLESTTAAGGAHDIGGSQHTADSWADFKTKINDATPLAASDVDDTPVDGETAAPVSSNWAYDHNAAKSGVHGAGAGNVLNTLDVDDTPVNGEVSVPVSSNWAYDHEQGSDPHGVYELEANVAADSKAACVSDAVYGAGWNGVGDVAPSKNAVYDKIEALTLGQGSGQRICTIIVACSDASAAEKATADYTLTGTTGNRVDHTTWSTIFDDIHTAMDAATYDWAYIKVVGSNIWKAGSAETHIGHFILDLGRVKIHDSTSNKFLTCTGALGSNSVALSSNCSHGDVSLAYSTDITGWLAKGDAFLLYQAHATNDLVNTFQRGELQRAENVTASTCTLVGSALDNYLTANTATIKEIEFLDDITIIGGHFRSDDTVITGNYRAFTFDYCSRVKLIDCLFDNISACAIEFRNCIDVYARVDGWGCGRSGEGYLIALYGATTYADLDIKMDSARHTIAGNGIVFGGPKKVHIYSRGINGDATYNSGIDCHHCPGDYWTVEGEFNCPVVAALGVRTWAVKNAQIHATEGGTSVIYDRTDGTYTEQVTLANLDVWGAANLFSIFSSNMKKVIWDGIRYHRPVQSATALFYESAVPAGCKIWMSNVWDIDYNNTTYGKIHLIAGGAGCEFYGDSLHIQRGHGPGVYLQDFDSGHITGGEIKDNDKADSATQGQRADITLNNTDRMFIFGVDIRRVDTTNSHTRYGIESYGTGDYNHFVCNRISNHETDGISHAGANDVHWANFGYDTLPTT